MKKLSFFFNAVYFSLFLSFFSPAPIFAATQKPELSVEKIFNEQADSIVVVTGVGKKGNRMGSGFVVREDGLIVTNAHILAGAKKVGVKLRGQNSFQEASLVSSNSKKDIALLKIDASSLKSVKLGNSSQVQIGERVVTIGNPLGLESTVSDGLISAWRKVKSGFKVLQISVPLSEGSSGGPLFNLQGQVVGVTTASQSKGQNLNFAVPINDVKQLLSKSNLSRLRSQLVKKEKIYVVQPKDNLYKLAQRFNTTIPDLMKRNGLTDSRIHRGQKIRVPAQ